MRLPAPRALSRFFTGCGDILVLLTFLAALAGIAVRILEPAS